MRRLIRGFAVSIGFCVGGLSGCFDPDSDSEEPRPGTLQFSNAGFIAGEASGSAPITVSRQGGASSAVSVLLFIVGGTAAAGADYPVYIDYVADLEWADGDASDKVVSLPLFDDALLEGAETIQLALALPLGGATLGTTSGAVLTVVDNENPLSGSLQFASAGTSAIESAGIAAISVTRTGGNVGAVSVQVYLASGTVTIGGDVPQWIDFVAELTWADGDGADRSFQVPIFDDATAEFDETVQFILLYPTGGAALGAPADTVLTIIDDD